MIQKIALCQLLPKANSPQENYSVMEKVVKDCAEKKVKLCIFPEDFLNGIVRDGEDLLNASKSFFIWVKKFKDLSVKYKIDLIPGSFPRYEKGRIFNSTVYINYQGKVLNQYSKNNLWLSERIEYSSAYKSGSIFESVLGKTILMICWDIFNHKLFEDAVKKGAKWVVIPAFWSSNQSADAATERGVVEKKYHDFSDSKMIDSLIKTRVAEYNIGIIFCNFAGTHMYVGNNGKVQKAISANRTQVVTPFNQIYKSLANRKEKVLVVDLPSIEAQIKDFEVYYGRREDIVNSYPVKCYNFSNG